MYRKYINDLIDWLHNDRRKPLMVWGARQVGKTYLMKTLFAEKYFKNKYIYIDCRVEHDFVNYCMNHINPKEIINYLSLSYDMVIGKDTLLIFDEAQECLPIITLMKYFNQDYKEIPIIVSGSMVRIKIQRENKKRGTKHDSGFLFPVGNINQLTIYPMNFEEFLINRNKSLYDEISTSFKEGKQCTDLVHQKALEVFYEYMLVGGMPEAVNEFISTGDYQKARQILKDLYDNYLSDMDLYQASSESIVRSKKIYENIFSQLNKESKNFKSTIIGSNLKNRDLRNPIDWLELAYIINKSSLVKEKISLPLISSEESLFRLYLSDIGMFSYQSKVNPITFIDKNSRNTLSGIFIENYVASELIFSNYKLFYWRGKNDAEFEFIIEYNSKIIPIDAKKSRGSLKSLEKFKNHNELYLAIKISENKLGYNDSNKILTIPLYLVPFLMKVLQQDGLDDLIKQIN
ncbi:MAG: ATP-binding protein [Bacilli bacterium]